MGIAFVHVGEDVKNEVMKLAVATAPLGCASCDGPGNVVYPSWYVMPTIDSIDPDRVFGLDKRGEGLGLKFGRAVSPSWDMQVGGSYSRANNSTNRYQQDLPGVDALYMLSRDRFRSFLLAGIGAEYDKANFGGGKISKTAPYLTAGAGFQYAFSDQWAMQADFRRTHGYLGHSPFNHHSAATITSPLVLPTMSTSRLQRRWP